MPLKGFLINIEMLVAVALFSVFFYAYAAGLAVSWSSLYGSYAALSGKEAAEAQVQAAISALYGSDMNLSAYASALNSTVRYGHLLLPLGYEGVQWKAPGYDTFYRIIPINGRIYYLEVYSNETTN